MVDMAEYNKLLVEAKAGVIAYLEKEIIDIVKRAEFTQDVLQAKSFADLEDVTTAYSTELYLSMLAESNLEL